MFKSYPPVMVLFMIVSSFLIVSCDKAKEADEKTKLSEQIVVSTNPNLIEIPHPEDFPVVKADSRMLPEELAANGVIAPDIGRTVAINVLGGGRVVEIHAKLGDSVKKGQLLLKMHSPDLANATAVLKQARANELLAQRQYDRYKFLYENGEIVAQKELHSVENALIDAKADTENAVTQVKLLNGNPKHPSAYIELRAPIDGTIVEQNVALGATVKSMDTTPSLFTIADLSTVWLLCDIYENNLAQISLGYHAKIRFNAYSDRIFLGKVSNISSILDPQTRNAKVRIELDNPEGILRPGMFATATLVSESKTPQIVIPSSALFRMHEKYWVFFPRGGNKFQRAEVQAGAMQSDGYQQISTGLQTGEEIVANPLLLFAAAKSENPFAFQELKKKDTP